MQPKEGLNAITKHIGLRRKGQKTNLREQRN